jgi:hypothetical protein
MHEWAPRTAAELRRQASLCRRLAENVPDVALRARLNAEARRYEEEARKLDV